MFALMRSDFPGYVALIDRLRFSERTPAEVNAAITRFLDADTLKS